MSYQTPPHRDCAPQCTGCDPDLTEDTEDPQAGPRRGPLLSQTWAGSSHAHLPAEVGWGDESSVSQACDLNRTHRGAHREACVVLVTLAAISAGHVDAPSSPEVWLAARREVRGGMLSLPPEQWGS